MAGSTQPAFRTVVPSKPVLEGEVFTIQYVWEDAEKISNFHISPFKEMKLVNGPISYKGMLPSKEGVKQVQNFVFTVMALKKGKFDAPRASGTWNGKSIESTDAFLTVISAADALKNSQKADLTSGSFLDKGEDPVKKIKANLFLKVGVDRKETFVGQPVVATYKLYSRLESRSEIIKNPGFYGFSVYDMINLQDKMNTTETVNGKTFDVHIVRQVQLYPMQSGKLIIDPMEIHNQVSFTNDPNKEPHEQEIAEGMLGNNDKPVSNENYESQISSEPIVIYVAPLPEKTKPANFNGAVGSFTATTRVIRNELAQNEEGLLEIALAGKGNFIQLSAPQVHWPAGVEGFEASVIDSLEKTHSPLQGKRIFRYPFVSATAGIYQIQSIELDFFDVDSGRFRTIRTEPITVKVTRQVANNSVTPMNVSTRKKFRFFLWLSLLLLFVLLFLFYKRKAFQRKEVISDKEKRLASSFLAPLSIETDHGETNFYMALRSAIWDYFVERLGMDGSGLNKDSLAARLSYKKVPSLLIDEIMAIIITCEEFSFTKAEGNSSRAEIFTRSTLALEKIDKFLYSAYL